MSAKINILLVDGKLVRRVLNQRTREVVYSVNDDTHCVSHRLPAKHHALCAGARVLHFLKEKLLVR